MFNANAAYIKEGELFFAEIHSVDEQLKSAGIEVGDIVLCQHVEKSTESPIENLVSNIWASKEADSFEWTYDQSSDDWSWMVYSGRPNGKGFINEKWKAKALEFLGGSWQ
ncbi:hypothetical protein pA_gene0005 [Vibrio phage 13VT501A]|nr:hypothetical protein pA_gene0005 [Vibrio phage 13VT501A]